MFRDLTTLFSVELTEQRKFWLRTLPRGKHAAQLFGEASAPAYAAVILLLCVVAVFYLKIMVFARSFQGWSPRVCSRVLSLTQLVWGILSSSLGLALFVLEVYRVGGGARLLNGLAGGSVKPFRLPLTWAITFNCLALDAALTVLASAPFLLRCATNLVPSLFAAAYPPFPPPAREAKEGAQAADSATAASAPPAPALGSAAEALRALDCTDLVLTRLLELCLMFCLHKYQS